MVLLYSAKLPLSNDCAPKSCKIQRLFFLFGHIQPAEAAKSGKGAFKRTVAQQVFGKDAIARRPFGFALVLEDLFHRERFHTPYSTHDT